MRWRGRAIPSIKDLNLNTKHSDLSTFTQLDPSGLRLFKPLAAIRFLNLNTKPRERSPIHMVTYADDTHGVRGGLYVSRQKAIQRDLERSGLARCLTYNFKDLQKQPEYKVDPSYFALHPFMNGHAFKPVIIRKALDSIRDGEYLFYYDASRFLPGRTICLLQRLCDAAGGVLAWQYGDPNAMWVKRAVFEACGDYQCNSLYAPHLASTWFLFKVDLRFRKFIQKWSDLNCRREIAEERQYSHASHSEISVCEREGYLENRGDQSIFSVLCALYGYSGFFGAGNGFNRSLHLFVASMWTGSKFFRMAYKVRAEFGQRRGVRFFKA